MNKKNNTVFIFFWKYEKSTFFLFFLENRLIFVLTYTCMYEYVYMQRYVMIAYVMNGRNVYSTPLTLGRSPVDQCSVALYYVVSTPN